MRRTKTPKPGESQDAPREVKPGAREFRSRWDLEEDRVIQHLRAAGWHDRAILEQIQEVGILSWSSLMALAETAGPFHFYTEERYAEFGL